VWRCHRRTNSNPSSGTKKLPKSTPSKFKNVFFVTAKSAFDYLKRDLFYLILLQSGSKNKIG